MHVTLALLATSHSHCSSTPSSTRRCPQSSKPRSRRPVAVGLMIGFGRTVAIVAPIFTGYLLELGWTPADAYVLFAGALVLAGIATLLLDLTYRGRSEDPETPEVRAALEHVTPRLSEDVLRDR